MGIWDKLRHELIDIIQWLDDTGARDTIVYRFERYNNEIKYGAKLVVREGQVGVFINEGKLADVFQPGTYTLTTQNLPILATLKGWKYGFESPFKAEVYFVSTRQFTDLKWGTMNPIMLRDPEFGPVRLRAFGTYIMRVKDAGTFIRQVVGTDGRVTTEDIVTQLRNTIVARFADIVGESKIPILDLASNYDELGKFLGQRMQPDFDALGVELPKLLIENISLPPEVEAALDKRSSMGVIGDLNKYMQFQAAESMTKAAENPSGTAGAGMGMGMGFAMANQMAQSMAAGTAGMNPMINAGAAGGGPSPAPPPLPSPPRVFVAVNGQQAGPFDLDQLRQMAASGELRRDSLVWKDGMSAWTAAGSVPDIASVFAASPPPLPPQ
ncbi:MAG: SPFH domain-containing protein [Phycisphaerales bacterium]